MNETNENKNTEKRYQLKSLEINGLQIPGIHRSNWLALRALCIGWNWSSMRIGLLFACRANILSLGDLCLITGALAEFLGATLQGVLIAGANRVLKVL